jgi:enoyl-CoA hydratase
MDYETVTLEKEGRVGRITLNRPEKLNAINDTMFSDLEAALEDVQRDRDIWVVIIKGAGRSFSAGQDISGVGASEVVPLDPRTKPYLSDIFEGGLRSQARWRAIFDFPRFTIAQVHGYCLGAACDLAMACNTIIAAEDAVFGDPSIRVGLASPNPLWTWRVGLKKAKELLLTGKYIDGKEAERLGLVMKAVPAGELDGVVRAEVEAQLKFGGIGGYDMLVGWRAAHDIALDMAGLSAAWRYATYIHNISSIQRPGRSFIERGGLNFYELREQKGLRAAIEARDGPFRKYFPPPPPPKGS